MIPFCISLLYIQKLGLLLERKQVVITKKPEKQKADRLQATRRHGLEMGCSPRLMVVTSTWIWEALIYSMVQLSQKSILSSSTFSQRNSSLLSAQIRGLGCWLVSTGVFRHAEVRTGVLGCPLCSSFRRYTAHTSKGRKAVWKMCFVSEPQTDVIRRVHVQHPQL